MKNYEIKLNAYLKKIDLYALRYYTTGSTFEAISAYHSRASWIYFGLRLVSFLRFLCFVLHLLDLSYKINWQINCISHGNFPPIRFSLFLIFVDDELEKGQSIKN